MHIFDQGAKALFSLLRVAAHPPKVVEDVLRPHHEENFVPEPLDQRVVEENLALVDCILLENVVEGQQNILLKLYQLSKVAISEIFFVMDAREE